MMKLAQISFHNFLTQIVIRFLNFSEEALFLYGMVSQWSFFVDGEDSTSSFKINSFIL
jgi:hypothetical protein